MKKSLYVLIIFSVLFSNCTKKSNTVEDLGNIYFSSIYRALFHDIYIGENISIEYNNYAFGMHDNRVWDNLEENELIEDLNKILDKPFKNTEIYFPRITDSVTRVSINEILKLISIEPSNAIIEIFDSLNNDIIKISVRGLNIYITKRDDEYTIKKGDEYTIFYVEYYDNNSFEPIIEIGVDKHFILDNFGQPARNYEERNIFIYQSLETGRYLIIYFDSGNKVRAVQIVKYYYIM